MGGVVIVPGLHNSGPRHWQTLWQQRLPDCSRISLRQWARPDLQAWTDAVVETAHKQRASYLVAHSFGCLAAINALASIESVRSVLLVAPADPEKFGVASQLPHSPLPVPGLVVGSLTDPWFTWTKAQQWAQRWQLPIYCVGDGGHINAESGHGDWPEGWELLQRLMQYEALQWRPPLELRRSVRLAMV